MRVCLAVDDLMRGGTQRQIVALVRALREAATGDVVVAVQHGSGDYEAAVRDYAEELKNLDRRKRSVWAPVWKLRQLLVASRVDLVHTMGFYSGVFGLIAARWARLPVVNGAIRAAPPVLRSWERVSLACALASDRIVSNSQAGLNAYGIGSLRRAVVIRNGISLADFKATVVDRDVELTACMVANFSALKDHVSAVRALTIVRKRYPRARLVLVGKDLGTLRTVRQAVETTGNSGYVDIFTGVSDPRAVITQAAISLVLSSKAHGEGISNSVMEAMALSRPVIATSSGGNAEIIQDGLTGRLVAAEDPQRVADAWLQLLADRQLASSMGTAARNVIAKDYSLERLAHEYQTLYREVIG